MLTCRVFHANYSLMNFPIMSQNFCVVKPFLAVRRFLSLFDCSRILFTFMQPEKKNFKRNSSGV